MWGMRWGIGGAALRLLDHRARPFAERRRDRLGAMPDHDDRTVDAGLRERGEDVVEHRPTGQRMEHLRDAGSHAGALAGGQDDGRGGVLW